MNQILRVITLDFLDFQSTEKEWQKIFFVGAGLFIGTNVIFVLFGSGKIQKWNRISNEEAADDINKTEMNVVAKSEEIH